MLREGGRESSVKDRFIKSGESRVLRCDERSNRITLKKSKKKSKKRKKKEKKSLNAVEMFSTLKKNSRL